MPKVPEFMSMDGTDDRLPRQNYDPNSGFSLQAAANFRTINNRKVSDATVTHRGSKNLIWSSEGFTVNNVTLQALTAAQKRASGNQNINLAGAVLDLSPYKRLLILANLTGISGGSSPSLQFALNYLDDTTGTAGVFPIWTPSAMTATGVLSVGIGPGCSGSGAVTLPVGPNGQFTWTVSGGPTTLTWTAWIYGLN